jgi:A/G-specific adenine glycosylase
MPTRKRTEEASSRLFSTLFGPPELNNLIPEPEIPLPTATPPARQHATSYHWPLPLTSKQKCTDLLAWFEGVQKEREMPWRKPWIDPALYADSLEGHEELAKALSQRAYEVWVSEIMLQQTRVSTVVPYFKNWIQKWPTVGDLAKAQHEEVLAAWKGLGFYSRGTRLWRAARDMVAEHEGDACVIPGSVDELMQFPGIGRYTAGAIASIAFGEAEPVLDGNVIRVLSRQLGLYVDGKDKKSSEVLWMVAERLVKHVASGGEGRSSKVPGAWNQALMELGATVCTPRPKCEGCPIRKTCRAYAEGDVLARKSGESTAVRDIEDACEYCGVLDTEELEVPPEDEDEEERKKGTKRRKRGISAENTLSKYFSARRPSGLSTPSAEGPEGQNDDSDTNGLKKRKAPGSAVEAKRISAYCSLFPKRVVKKKVAEEECVVCLIEMSIRGGSSKWLIEQRPKTGRLSQTSPILRLLSASA